MEETISLLKAQIQWCDIQINFPRSETANRYELQREMLIKKLERYKQKYPEHFI